MKQTKSSKSKPSKEQTLLLNALDASFQLPMANMKKLRREMGRLGREHLKMNGMNPKGLTGAECAWLANQHMRAFLGMDAPNVFTGTKK